MWVSTLLRPLTGAVIIQSELVVEPKVFGVAKVYILRLAKVVTAMCSDVGDRY